MKLTLYTNKECMAHHVPLFFLTLLCLGEHIKVCTMYQLRPLTLNLKRNAILL